MIKDTIYNHNLYTIETLSYIYGCKLLRSSIFNIRYKGGIKGTQKCVKVWGTAKLA